MSDKTIYSFHTLPVEIVYRILDNLNVMAIVFSARDVCSRLNEIIDNYHQYKV
jgi:hypothetical protein